MAEQTKRELAAWRYVDGEPSWRLVQLRSGEGSVQYILEGRVQPSELPEAIDLSRPGTPLLDLAKDIARGYLRFVGMYPTPEAVEQRNGQVEMCVCGFCGGRGVIPYAKEQKLTQRKT